ncbi:uncharacterized protein VTP21DRAFT_6575 [Calcarisporiella thermophila]|uniref:uncharacterized protein n=1 Tax=Calcarisporiella thermophila TaxID=911321 RepID=UPI0037436BEE
MIDSANHSIPAEATDFSDSLRPPLKKSNGMLLIDGPYFKEQESGRILFLRGINLSGGTKLPVGIPSHDLKDFWVDHDRFVNFVGRPFSLEDADTHLQRLKNLGFNFLRYLVTWEALEHEGPGIYDVEYIEYVIQVLKKCKQYGFRVFIDPHQDVWSRHCGGSGAPGWTLTLVGLNPNSFVATNAAIVHNTYPDPLNFPKMVWSTNYSKLATATMMTLFFAGSFFAPKCIVDGVNIQEYLQTHFINAMVALAKRIVAEEGLADEVVVGYDTLNEPWPGYVGLKDLSQQMPFVELRKDIMPTPFQGFQLGHGLATQVEKWEMGTFGPYHAGMQLIDPAGARAWDVPEKDWTRLEGSDRVFPWWEKSSKWRRGECLWAQHGVWDPETGALLRPDYFYTNPSTGLPIDWARDCWVPYARRYALALRKVHPNAIIFAHAMPNEPPTSLNPSGEAPLERLVHSPHWYDGLTLISKKWRTFNVDYLGYKRGKYGWLGLAGAIRFGERAIRQCFVDQMELIRAESKEQFGDFPVLIGEVGIPFDLEGSGIRDGRDIRNAASPQSRALDANLHALDTALMNFTLWNYCPDNDPVYGDNWNGEDLSIFQAAPALKYKLQSQSYSEVKAHVTRPLRFSLQTRMNTTGSDSGVPLLEHGDGSEVGFSVSHSSSTTLTDTEVDNGEALPIDPAASQKTIYSPPPTCENLRDVPPLHRPYPHKVAGLPLSTAYEIIPKGSSSVVQFRFRLLSPPELSTHPTEIFLPKAIFPSPTEAEIVLTSGRWEPISDDTAHWILGWWVEELAQEQEIQISARVEVVLSGSTEADEKENESGLCGWLEKLCKSWLIR